MSQPQQQLLDAADQGDLAAEATAALEVVLRSGRQVQDKEKHFTSTRCFRVKATEGGQECTRWVFACNRHRDLKVALTTLCINGCLKACAINIGYDFAPRAKAAREVERLAFKSKPKAKKGRAQKKGKTA